MMITKDVKSVPSTPAEPRMGSFFPVNEESKEWIYCRETFWGRWVPERKVTEFYFYFDATESNAASIAAFISKVESILGVETESEFALTPRKNIIWVKPSQFWQCCPMRRSLFTALLRAGRTYKTDIDNFETALYSDGYLSETKNAVMRFLFGFTQFNAEASKSMGLEMANNRGWHYFFKGREVCLIRRILSSPEPRQELTIGMGQIWT